MIREDAQVDLTQLTQNWLESHHNGRWLMVLDNIDDADVFFREYTCNKKTLSQYIPRTGKGSLLFTTRSRDIAIDLILPATPVAVPVLTKSEGGRLLRSRVAGEHLEEHVVELLEELDYIPLAITQAAAFMSKRRRTIQQYLELYRKSDSARVRMLSYEFSDHGRQYNSMESVARTLIVSFESIRRGNPRSADLLSLMSYFDRHAIPLALVHDEQEDICHFEDTVAVLCAFSLIESDEAGTSFDMHSLVQLATKLWHLDEKGEDDYWAFEALKSLANKFPAPTDHPTPEYWAFCASFLPHAQLILAHDFKPQREEIELARATLLLSVANYIDWRGAGIESAEKTGESLKIREKVLGEKHPDTLRSLRQRVSSFYRLRKGQGCVDASRRCLKLRQEVLGEDHPETLDSLAEYALALQLQERFEESEKMQRQAFESSKRILGPEHPDTLTCLSNLASVLDDQCKYEEAETAAREAIRLKTKVFGGEDLSLHANLHNFAVILENCGKDDEAEELYRRVLALEEKVYGKGHVETIITTANLVLLLEKKEQWDDITGLSRRFLSEAYQAQEGQNPRLQCSIEVLKRFGFDGLG